jgi:tellurite resistance protein TerC
MTSDVLPWHWLVLVAVVAGLLLIDLLVLHREARVIGVREAAIHSIAWISIGLLFAVFIAWQFGGNATGEYFGSYLMEMSLSVDNVFIWAMLFAHFRIPLEFQHRVLFWGVFGALLLRSIFVFGGIAVMETFEPAILILGLFLVYTGFTVLRTKDNDDDFDPSAGRLLHLFRRVVPSTEEIRGQALIVRDARLGLLATPLLTVLVMIELTDIVFAVDSVSAVLSITSEQFLAISSNIFAILGLRALYFLLADVRARFTYLQRGIALILAFVGFKMIVAFFWDSQISTAWSLSFIVLVLAVSVGASVVHSRRQSS